VQRGPRGRPRRMAKRELTPLRTFTFPVVTHETIGPVRAETAEFTVLVGKGGDTD